MNEDADEDKPTIIFNYVTLSLVSTTGKPFE